MTEWVDGTLNFICKSAAVQGLMAGSLLLPGLQGEKGCLSRQHKCLPASRWLPGSFWVPIIVSSAEATPAQAPLELCLLSCNSHFIAS